MGAFLYVRIIVSKYGITHFCKNSGNVVICTVRQVKTSHLLLGAKPAKNRKLLLVYFSLGPVTKKTFYCLNTLFLLRLLCCLCVLCRLRIAQCVPKQHTRKWCIINNTGD